MPATASSLRDLHQLHQRAKALRDRLSSGPKTLAAKKAAAQTRQAKLDEAKKALQDEKLTIKRHEAQIQAHQTKNDDLTIKQNTIKKNDEFRALTSQINANKANIDKIEATILEAMERVDAKQKDVTSAEAEVKKFADEVASLAQQIETHAEGQKKQLGDLETEIKQAESCIDPDQRDRYARTVKQRGAEALAAVERSACTGCYVTVTGQMMNELINGQTLQFCMTCGRMLYLAEDDGPIIHRS